jgi:flagellar basal body-associated protein FliL
MFIRKEKGMNKRKIVSIVLVILIVLVLLLASCAPATYGGNNTASEGVANNNVDVIRYIDAEAGVVCWIFRLGASAACMPISETQLIVP